MAVPAQIGKSAVRFRRQQPQPQEQDDDSLLQDLLSGGGSALQYVGETLNKPSRALWGSLNSLTGGESGGGLLNLIPFSDTMGLTDPRKGVELSGFLEHKGVLPRNTPGFDRWDIPRFVADVAGDPLNAVGGLGLLKSFGKGGAVLAKAGGQAGKLSRVGRMTTSVGDLTKSIAPDALESAATRSGFASGADFIARHGSEPVGGLLSLNKPFGGPLKAWGTGPMAQKVGGGLDKLGRAVSYGNIPGTEFSPGRQFARVFSSRAKGLHTPEVAPSGERLFDEQELIHHGVRAETAKQFTKMAKGGALDDTSSILGRMQAEVPDFRADWLKPELRAKAKVMGEVLAPFRKQLDEEYHTAQRLGTRLEHFGDPAGIKYLPREAIQMVHNYAHSFGREEYLRGIELGTENLRRMIADPKILDGTFDEAMEYVKREWVPKFVERTGEDYLFRTLVHRIRKVWTPEQRKAGLFGRNALQDTADGVLSSKMNNAKTASVIEAIAEHATSIDQLDARSVGDTMDVWEIMEKAGLNPGVQRAAHEVVPPGPPGTRIEGPVQHEIGAPPPAGNLEYEQRLLPGETAGGMIEAQSNLPATRRGLTQINRREVAGEIVDDAAQAKAPKQPARNGALYRVIDALAEKRGIKQQETAEFLQSIGHMVVPRSIGEDIVRLAKGDDIKNVVGTLLQMFDAATNLFKVSVLNWPSRYSRDFTSSQAMNILTGNFSPRAFDDLHKMISGGTGDFTDIPIIQQMLAEQGLEATAENSTEMMRQLFYTYEKHTAVAGLHGTSEIVGEGSGALPGGTEAFAAEFPGRDPISPLSPSTLNAGAPVNTLAAWNPLNVRGVGGRLKSGAKLPAMGERLGRYTDTMGRGVAFITNLRRGVAPEQASRIADGLQVNYSPRTFTAAERKYLKRAFPFYSFVSRMLPEVTKQLLDRPGGGIAQSIRAANDLRSESEGPVPEYVGKGLAIPLGETDTGDQRYLTALDLMHESPLNVLGMERGAPSLAATARNILSQGNPYLKGLGELAFGKTLFQDRELEDADPTIGRLLTNVGLQDESASGRAKPFGGTTVEQLAANSPLSRVFSSLRTATDPRKGLVEKGVNLLTGARISDISPAAQDAVLRDALAEITRTEGGKAFESVRFTKAQIAAAQQSDPELAQRMLQLNAAAAKLAERAKKRKQAAKKAR